MGIRTKRAPRQLDDEIVETVWPGDSAVDLEQSDLVAWCRGSGSAGLVMAGTEKPDLIKWRALSDQALSHVMRSIMAESPNAMDEAFRYGLVSITGGGLRWGRPVDIRGLEDESLRELAEIQMSLPWHVCLDEVHRAQGIEPKGGSEDLMPVSLVKAIGAQILARTFRTRSHDA